MINFPDNPTVGQLFSAGSGNWTWDGVKWTGEPGQLYLPLAGGQMTGPLLLSEDPQAPTEAATKEYVDGGKNYVDNALFRVQQRGTGPWTANLSYTADRWVIQLGTAGGSRSITVNAFAPAGPGPLQIGDEEAAYFLQYVFTGGSAAADTDILTQRIESVQRLSGKTVTLSFWANAAAALTIGLNVYEYFGTGGSPSAAAYAFATGQTFNLTTTWQRYSITFAMPSAAGKTFGTTVGTDYTALQFFLSSGATSATGGGVGVQSGTVNFWGVQLEVSPTASPLEKIRYSDDLARCRRFFHDPAFGGTTGNMNSWGGYVFGAAALVPTWFLPVQMRATPTVTMRSGVYGGAATNIVYQTANSMGFTAAVSGSSAGYGTASFNYTASADL